MKHLSFLQRTWWVAGLMLLGLLAAPAARAQAPAWQTVMPISGTQSYVTASVADARGNVYLTGNFTGTAVFGATTLTSTGSGSDVFVAKWDLANNRFVWALRAGGDNSDFAKALALNGPNVYITGSSGSASVSFDTITLINANSNATDLFVAKLTDTGPAATFTWARRAGNSGYSHGDAIAVSGAAVYVAGAFTSSTLTLGTTVLVNSGSSSSPTSNGFVCKLLDDETAGTFTWTQRCGSESIPKTLAISGNNLYVAGTFAGTGIFGSTALTATSDGNLFIARLADQGSAGSYTWANQVVAPSNSRVNALAISGTSIYMAGSFVSTATFGNTSLSCVGSDDAFVAKLTDAGSSAAFTWAVRAGGTDIEEATAIVADGTHVYVSGGTGSPSISFGATTLTHATNTYFRRDGFVAQLTDTGSSPAFTWAKAIGGDGNDRIDALALSGTTLFTGGYISPPASFDNFTVPASAGLQIGFLSTLSTGTVTASTPLTRSATLAVFPNPARTTATVTLPAPLPATLILVDALGRPVRTVHLTASATILNIEDLLPGIYLLYADKQTARLVVE